MKKLFLLLNLYGKAMKQYLIIAKLLLLKVVLLIEFFLVSRLIKVKVVFL